jgi:hypothetical protein
MSVASSVDLAKSRFASVTNATNRTSQGIDFDEDTRSRLRRESTFFPLFSEIAQTTKIPFEIYLLSLIIIIVFRCLAAGFWPGSRSCWPDDSDFISII